MPLYERVGLPLDMIDPANAIPSVEMWLRCEDREDIASTRRFFAVTTGHIIALGYYYLDDHQNACLWAGKVLEFAEEYFLGQWRDRVHSGSFRESPPDRTWWDRHASWRMPFEPCLLWGSCLGEWDRLRRLAGCLRDDVKTDIEQTAANRAWLLLVAGTLVGRPWEEMVSHRQVILGSKRKREKLLLGILEAILHGTDEELAAASKAYFRYYKQSESRVFEITAKIACDGTFLVNYARHVGREIPVPANVADHIVVLGQ